MTERRLPEGQKEGERDRERIIPHSLLQLDRWSLVLYPGVFVLYNIFFLRSVIKHLIFGKKEYVPIGPPGNERLKAE